MVKMPHKLIDLVKGTTATMIHCKGGKVIYQINVSDTKYTFPIDITDRNEVGDSIFELTDKASIFMRYIKKAIKAYEAQEDPSAMIRWETI